jgi:hypothetical protein
MNRAVFLSFAWRHISYFADTSNKNSELIEKAASSQDSATEEQEDESTDTETKNANTKPSTFEQSPASGLTPEQQQHAGQRPRGRDRSSQDSDGGWTPHRRLNVIVYIILVSGAFIVLDREYGGILSVWLRVHFPREAATLGFKIHRGVV